MQMLVLIYKSIWQLNELSIEDCKLIEKVQILVDWSTGA